MTLTFRRPESVLVLIYDQNQHILALQRQDDSTFWQSVTGSLELGEKPEQTAHREVLEETSIDIRTLGLNLVNLHQSIQYEIRPEWRYRYHPNHQFNTEHWFKIEVPCGIPIKLTEHITYEWLSIEEALQKMWSPSNREVIRKCFEKGDK